MRIQHNIMAMNAYRNYTNNTSALSKNLEKLSSGYKINRAGDDAAGLAISEKMRAQITGLEGAQKNAKDGISLVQTAEGALTEVHDMLNRMYSLAEQSANGTYDDDTDRVQLQKEVDQLRTEIDRIADSSNFNGIQLLDGSLSSGGAATSDGTTFIGANVSKFSSTQTIAFTVTGTGSDMSGIDTTKYSTEIYIIDGQKLEIDMSKGNGATIASLLDKSFNGAGNQLDDDAAKKLANDLTEAFNAEIQAQGLKGEVKFSVSGNNIVMESLRTDGKGEFSFGGVTMNGGAVGTEVTYSVGAHLFGGGTAVTGAVTIKAKQEYNGGFVTANEVFNMDINGVKVAVTIGTAISPQLGATNATTMDAAASTIQSAIQAAVAKYNEALGLTPGVLDKQSGLTGLTTTDFTVEADANGGFKIIYDGDEDVNFSFSDVGDRDVAQRLGLANGSSSQGGAGGLTLQIGDTSDSYNQLNVSINDCHARSLGINNLDISDQNGAQSALKTIEAAINYVSDVRGTLGATQNRLDHTINNLSVMQENIQDAESSIRDTDIADEMMEYTKNNILIQSAQAMLAQANQVPQGVLQLLQ